MRSLPPVTSITERSYQVPTLAREINPPLPPQRDALTNNLCRTPRRVFDCGHRQHPPNPCYFSHGRAPPQPLPQARPSKRLPTSLPANFPPAPPLLPANPPPRPAKHPPQSPPLPAKPLPAKCPPLPATCPPPLPPLPANRSLLLPRPGRSWARDLLSSHRIPRQGEVTSLRHRPAPRPSKLQPSRPPGPPRHRARRRNHTASLANAGLKRRPQ